MSALADLRERVLAVVRERGPLSANAVVVAAGGRRADVLAVLRAYERTGQVRSTPDGIEAAGTMREPVPRPRSSVTAAELDRLPRRERVRATWAAMSPAAQERAWAALDGERRVEALALLLGGRIERERVPFVPVTRAAAQAAWEREADR